MKRSRSSRSTSAPHCIAPLSRLASESGDMPDLPVYRKSRKSKAKPAPKPAPVVAPMTREENEYEEFRAGLAA